MPNCLLTGRKLKAISDSVAYFSGAGIFQSLGSSVVNQSAYIRIAGLVLTSNSYGGSVITEHVIFCWCDRGPFVGPEIITTILELNLPPSNTITWLQGTETLTIKAHAVRQGNNASEVCSIPCQISRRPASNVQHGRNDGGNIALLKVRKYSRYCDLPTALVLVRSTG
jgi:hypothetical protein